MELIKMRMDCYSEALGRPVKISALLPNVLANNYVENGKKLKSLYILAGAMGDREDIFSQMDLQAYMQQKGYDDIAVFSFSPSFGFYTDYINEYDYGLKYYTFVTRELISITRDLFPISGAIEDTAIYGCSMGGWGSFSCGLNNPDIYGYVGAQSGMVDMQWAVDIWPFMTVKHQRQFGDDLLIHHTQNDLYYVLKKLNEKAASEGGPVPKIYQSWGEEDYLLVPNEK